MEKNEIDFLKELSLSYKRWEELFNNGGSDPFWSDGVNLNIVRNHIIYWKRRIGEEKPELMESELYKKPIPKKMSNGYMACSNEIRIKAKKVLDSIYDNADYKYICSHYFELSDEEKNETKASLIINVVNGYEKSLLEDNLIELRRLCNFSFDLFEQIKLKVSEKLSNSTRQLCLF